MKLELKIPKLYFLTVLFLTIPFILFVVLWTRFYVSFPLLLLVIFFIFGIFKDDNSEILIGIHEFVLIILGVFFWLSLSGIGGWGEQNSDYVKHNLIYSLFETLGFPPKNGDSPVVYYFGYYLFPSIVGILRNWDDLLKASFLQAFVGLVFVFLWIKKISGAPIILIIITVIGFSGLDFIGAFVSDMIYGLNMNYTHQGYHIEFWPFSRKDSEQFVLQLSSNTTLLYWVPQHAICGWLATSLIYFDFTNKRSTKYWTFITAMTFLWSIFSAFGLIVLFIINSKMVFENKKEINLWLGSILIFFMLTFFLSNQNKLPQNFILENTAFVSGFLFICFFVLIEIGWALALIFYSRIKREYLYSTIIASVFLFVLCMFRFGYYNDLLMRASIPSLFLLCLFVIIAFTKLYTEKRVLASLVFYTLFIFGSITAYYEIYRSAGISYVSRKSIFSQPLPNGDFSNLPEKIRIQYEGNKESFFFKYLAKQ